MKITLTDLFELTKNSHYCQLPKDIARDKESEDDPWTSGVDKVIREAIKETTWKICQMVGILFDKYEDGLSSVKVRANIGQDGEDIYLSFEAHINDVLSNSITIIPYSLVIDGWDKLGDVGDLKRVLMELEGMGNTRLVSDIYYLRELLPEAFTSAQQARQLAQEAAPEINSWVKGRLLEQAAAAAQAKTEPRPRGRISKL